MCEQGEECANGLQRKGFACMFRRGAGAIWFSASFSAEITIPHADGMGDGYFSGEKGIRTLARFYPATAFRVLYPERTLAEVGRKKRLVLDAPESRKSRLFQGNFT